MRCASNVRKVWGPDAYASSRSASRPSIGMCDATGKPEGSCTDSCGTATSVTGYFSRPHRPWERGTNQNTNGLIRQYLAKGASMADVTQAQCNQIAYKFNTRARKRYAYDTPQQRLSKC